MYVVDGHNPDVAVADAALGDLDGELPGAVAVVKGEGADVACRRHEQRVRQSVADLVELPEVG